MRVKINGKSGEFLEPKLSLYQLMERLNIPSEGLAVAVNFEVIRQSEWKSTFLRDDDQVEIVRARQGG